MTEYFEAICAAMTSLGQREDSIFIGQSIAYPGTAMTDTLKGVPNHKLIEVPVFEETQCGMAIGMALYGLLPICIYPRWNFLLLATNQIVNHLDKIPLFSHGEYNPRVLIRVGVPTPHPLDPGEQHLGNFAEAFRMMLKTVQVLELHQSEEIGPAYDNAVNYEGSTILAEFTGRYYD
jgi:pyruvate/2-oxoglutarate/acetoin dehydrogenase E1 component